MDESPSLRHFPKQDPAPISGNERQSAEIEQQTLDYLAKGREIEQVDHTANHAFKQPLKRTRKEQIQYIGSFHCINKTRN